MDSRSQRNRAGRKGGELLTRACGSSYNNGLPPRSAPQCPLSRMVTPYAQTAQHGTVRRRLYHAGYKRHREYEHATAQDHQNPWSLPERRGGDSAAPAGAAQSAGQKGALGLRLEISHEPVCYPVRRAIYASARLTICSTVSATKIQQVLFVRPNQIQNRTNRAAP